jgi:hypothetical protein
MNIRAIHEWSSNIDGTAFIERLSSANERALVNRQSTSC